MVSKHPIADSLGRMQNTLFVNEDGMYDVVLESRKENAKKFRKWVTSEVLPSIRKNGGYIANQNNMTPAEIVANALIVANNIIEEKTRELEIAQKKNAELLDDNLRMKPKEIFADAVSASDSSMLVRDVAKIIKQNGVPLGEKRFYKWLRDNGYVCQGSTSPTQKAMELGLFEIVVRTVERGNGLPIETKTTKVTGKGQQYFINKFLNADEKSA